MQVSNGQRLCLINQLVLPKVLVHPGMVKPIESSQPVASATSTLPTFSTIQSASAMPATATLVLTLRAEGLAAVVAGAGPSALVLGERSADVLARVQAATGEGWTVSAPGIDTAGAVATTQR